jgi:hypothetical protein
MYQWTLRKEGKPENPPALLKRNSSDIYSMSITTPERRAQPRN